jgi:hypothetical protein
VRALAAGRLGHERHAGQERMRQQRPERLHADLALPDRLVPVALGAEPQLRVVGVHQLDPARSGGSRDLSQHLVDAAGGGEVVPGGEQVAGVQADPGLRMPLQRVQVRPEFLRAGAQHLALARHRLEQQVRVLLAERFQHRQQQLRHLAQRVVTPPAGGRPGRGARVHHHAARPDLPAAAQRVRDGRRRPPGDHAVGGAEVDQVRRVDEHRQPGLAQPGVLRRIARAGRPAPRVRHEDLDDLGLDRRGVPEPPGREPAGHGRVRPDKRHVREEPG